MSQICRYFSTTGQCFYGDNCNFQHIQPNASSSSSIGGTMGGTVIGGGGGGVTMVNAMDVQVVRGVNMPSSSTSTTSSSSSSSARLSSTNAAPIGGGGGGANTGGHVGNTTASASTGSTSWNQTPSFVPIRMAPTSASLPFLQPSLAGPASGYRSPFSFGAGPSLRDEWESRRKASLQPASEKDPRLQGPLKAGVGPFHSLTPLDDATRDTTLTFFGFHSPVFRARHQGDGQLYVLRSLRSFRHPTTQATTVMMSVLERWKQIRHPSIVGLRECFIVDGAQAQDMHIWFVYDYHPASKTIEAAHLVASAATGLSFSEDLLWSYICQLASALQAIHARGLACRCIFPSKILVTGRNRVRINGVGVADSVHFDPPKIALQQMDDLVSLGKLIICLACKSAAAAQNVQRSLEYIGAHFSADLKNIVILLLSTKATTGYAPSIEDVMLRLASRLAVQMDNALDWADTLEGHLGRELDNGRLFRLISKLGFINERPEFLMDPSWSETGDRYLLKLLRDYIFHQVYEDGTPMVSLGHVVDSLNKLDVGVPEKIPLVSRDHQTVLLCSFKDLKKCVDDSFNQLVKLQADRIKGKN